MLSLSCKLMKLVSNQSHLLVTTCLSFSDTAIKKFYFIDVLIASSIVTLEVCIRLGLSHLKS